MIYFRKGKFEDGALGLDLTQPAFRTGYGFFETIAWNGRKICHLDLHLERARKSLAEFKVVEETVNYSEIITEVVKANGLENEFARVNIFFPVEGGRAFPVISAVSFEYVPDRVWKLRAYEDVFLSSLMRHKSMNRMNYLQAWQDAVDHGFDDALLLDFDGNVLESSFASLLFQKGDSFYEPETIYKLPGTARALASQLLDISAKPISLESVYYYDHVYALNSLGGMVPVSCINYVKFDISPKRARDISRIVLELE